MLQIGNKPIDTIYVGGKLVQQVYKGSKKVYPEHGVIPKAIKDSMVLWYDLKRQGATNESMAADPTLRDLSGNGHDATCYNFAWTEESGISTTNYPHALVSDGVDDYAMVEGLPLFTPETGYTVIAKRKVLYSFDESSTKFFLSKIYSFGIDCLHNQEGLLSQSFGGRQHVEQFFNENFVAQTSTTYNNNPIVVGSMTDDSNKLYLFSFNNSGYRGNSALYSLLLFNRDLTPEEIAWVKTNLMS